VEDRFTVLVVDDDIDIRESLRDIIEAEGYPVVCAANGEAALQLLAELPRPGLIVLDLMMPMMSGWEFLALVRGDKALADIPVAVISASGGMRQPHGATCFLQKPVDLDTVLDLVREHCGMPEPRRPMRSAAARSHA
jgi:two-component system, OmpR family, response regulator CpxR